MKTSPLSTSPSLTVAEAADRLGVYPTTITRWCAAGLLKGAERVQNRWLIPESALATATPEATVSYTLAQVCAIWGCSLSTLYRLRREGKLKGIWQRRRVIRIPETTLLAFEAEHALN